MAIEFDPHLTKEEKLPFMVEWWSKARELLISCSVVRSDIEAAIKSSNLYLRLVSATVFISIGHCVVYIYLYFA